MSTRPEGTTALGSDRGTLRPPLEGIRVVALEQAVAMPFCSWALAELGAQVVKVERPGAGDVIRGWDHAVSGMSTGFVWLNAGKRDLAVDLSREEGQELVRRLAFSSDVFLENFAPGVAHHLGLGHERLRGEHPELVYCSLSGYGQDGPYREVKAYDLLIQGESGILLTNGTPEAPAKVGLPITDLVGGITAALGVVAALRRRDFDGQGEFIDVAMLDAVAPWLGYFPQYAWHQGTEPPRTGMRHQYLCPYGPYLAADGRYVNLVVASQRDWERFVDAVQRPQWLTDVRFSDIDARRKNRLVLEPLVEKMIAAEPSTAWLGRLEAAGLPYGEVRDMAGVLKHPQLVFREMFVEADSPAGRLPLVRFPLGSPHRPRRVPALGEHTAELLAELGYDAGECIRLVAEGVVAIQT